jgi:predicted alpha/beta-hydrolase family hydrolase
VKSSTLKLTGPSGPLSAELLMPDAPQALVVLAHGAGADLRHTNMFNIAAAFEAEGIASLRFNFPFMEQGKRRVDGQDVCVAAIAAAVEAGLDESLPLYLGGHSFGGRMASHAVVVRELPVRGLIFCSFPLHQPKKPATTRAEHLPQIQLPMLFLSGTRDALAEPVLLEEVIAGLGDRAQLHWLATADHSYKILKRQRSVAPSVFEEMAEVARAFIAGNSNP